MIAKYAALAFAGVLSLGASEPMHGTMNAGLPPTRFRGDTAAIVIFTDRAGIDAMCGVAPQGYRIVACKRMADNGVPVVVMPNPCGFGDVEYYARIQCHENGHVNGWSGNHEE